MYTIRMCAFFLSVLPTRLLRVTQLMASKKKKKMNRKNEKKNEKINSR